MKLIAKSNTNFACQIPVESSDFNCSTQCNDTPICQILGYYSLGSSCQKVTNQQKDCLNNPICGNSYIDTICKSSGYIDIDKGICGEIQASDCLNLQNQNIATYCYGPQSICVKKYKFIYDSNQQICSFNCLENYNCLDGSFCLKSQTDLGAFGYSDLNSNGKCSIDLSIDDCIQYKSKKYIYCPQACVLKYNLIQSPNGCLLPSHSDCDNAAQNSKYGCSTDKYLCKKLGWTQISKGSNQCKDPTNICLSQFQLCNQQDSQQYTLNRQNTTLGNYLGLVWSSTFGWMIPDKEQCKDQNLCQRPQSFCRKAGFILNPLTNNCTIPDMIKDCLGQEKCSNKFLTLCQKQFGFTNPSIIQKSTCLIPQNCSQLKKLDTGNHACEIGGFISLDKDMFFVNSKNLYNDLNINIDLNYNITLSYCLTQIKINNPICSSGTSVCNLIGFTSNKDGTCKYPLIESCLTPGSGKCSQNNICLRYFKLEKSQTNDDCVIPNKGDYTKCQYLFETPRVLLHYCLTYFGFKFIAASQLCTQQPSNPLCNSKFCNIFDNSTCFYTSYVQYNNYIQYDDIGLSNPLDYIFSKCTQDNCSKQCTLLGFTSCQIPQIQDCKLYDGYNYNHACHMIRAINAVDVANLCLNSPKCSKICQFYGFIQVQDGSCQIPDQNTCSLLGKTLDSFYHACGFQNFQNPDKIFVSQYCLRRGLKMCSSQDSICVKYYNFASMPDGSGDCQNPNIQYCLNLNLQIIPINCQVMVGFILKPVKLNRSSN
ncbi:hypothetical protein ABPG72_014983 [Tetrahymena utriculariae]